METVGFRLFDGEDLICGDIRESLHGAAGPGDLDFFDHGVRAQAEMNTGVDAKPAISDDETGCCLE